MWILLASLHRTDEYDGWKSIHVHIQVVLSKVAASICDYILYDVWVRKKHQKNLDWINILGVWGWLTEVGEHILLEYFLHWFINAISFIF